ncbi:MAG: hypothetical protein IIW85_08170, partial [Bacteroidaceae bacterium]|nr:hypothetical protein [Bacteroidaceae bacterium]
MPQKWQGLPLFVQREGNFQETGHKKARSSLRAFSGELKLCVNLSVGLLDVVVNLQVGDAALELAGLLQGEH